MIKNIHINSGVENGDVMEYFEVEYYDSCMKVESLKTITYVFF